MTIIQFIACIIFSSYSLFLIIKSIFCSKFTIGVFATSVIPFIVFWIAIIFSQRYFGGIILEIFGFVIFILGLRIISRALQDIKKQADDFWFSRFKTKQRRLVSEGLFGIVRHPIYLGMLLKFLGLFMVFANIISFAIFMIASLLIFITLYTEEKFLLKTFKNYSVYKSKTNMLLPNKMIFLILLI